MKSGPDSPPLEVYLLGLVDFDDAQRLQRRLVYDLGERPGAALVLCEHPPTISVGRSGSRAHILPDDPTLRSIGVKVHWVNRGGGCVLHLPGQLSAYFALSLERFDLTLNDYVGRLYQAVLGVLREFDLSGELKPAVPGVFLGHARVATIGVAVNRWVAYHGVTLNVGPFLEPFEMILDEPGEGPHALRQTSMESRRQRATPMPKVREAMIRHLELVFGLERHHVFTHHPLVRRKVLAHAYVPSPG
ncbi:MAG: lipoyl(octanoyl) transferase LipB [Isosphaeraceae bacterium]